MSTEDIVLYDTVEAVKIKPTATQVETFDLVPPDHPALYKVLPEFDFENAPINANSFASTLVETCKKQNGIEAYTCLLYTSPSPRDLSTSRMPSSA